MELCDEVEECEFWVDSEKERVRDVGKEEEFDEKVEDSFPISYVVCEIMGI